VRRTTALLLFVLGDALVASLSARVAAAPALAAFCAASLVLVRERA
jgi:hypothetical protein